MLLVKVLKRKDAASVLVAILVALILSQVLTSTTGELASKISGLHNGAFGYPSGAGWKNTYLFPVVWGILQLVLLEILGWVYVLAAGLFKRK